MFTLLPECTTLIFHSPYPSNGFRWKAFQDEDFIRIFNELTKKIKLCRVKNFERLSLNFNRYLDKLAISFIILWDSCQRITNESIRYLKNIIIKNFSGLKSLALNFNGSERLSLIDILTFSRKEIEILSRCDGVHS